MYSSKTDECNELRKCATSAKLLTFSVIVTINVWNKCHSYLSKSCWDISIKNHTCELPEKSKDLQNRLDASSGNHECPHNIATDLCGRCRQTGDCTELRKCVCVHSKLIHFKGYYYN